MARKPEVLPPTAPLLCDHITCIVCALCSRFLGELMNCSNEPDMIADTFLNNVRQLSSPCNVCLLCLTVVLYYNKGKGRLFFYSRRLKIYSMQFSFIREQSTKENKKSELMLMRRARAYSSFCSQVILVYLHPFRRNSLFSNQKSPKITKTPYFWGSRSIKVINVDNPKKLVASLVMLSSMSVPICNHFYVRQASSG